MRHSFLKRLHTVSLSILVAGALAGCLSDSTSPERKAEAEAEEAEHEGEEQLIERETVLVGEQENPPVESAAIALGNLTINKVTKAMSGHIVLDGLTATVAHVHAGAIGVNGGVVVVLTEGPAGTWSVPANTFAKDVDIEHFEKGELYFNAHSAAHASGEIRGQLGLEPFYAELTPRQEVPPKATAAKGAATLVLNPETKSVTGSIQTTGLTGTVAHIHTGVVGTNGGISVVLTETPGGSGKWVIPQSTVFSDAQITSLKGGGFYFNVHSAANPGGEIRGQIGRIVRFADLNGDEEVPPKVTAAEGVGVLSVDPTTRGVTGQITTTGVTGTVAHVHQGAVGVNGGIVIALTETPAGSGTWVIPANSKLSATAYKAFLEGELYFNVHSAANAAGEIRGQIEHE